MLTSPIITKLFVQPITYNNFFIPLDSMNTLYYSFLTCPRCVQSIVNKMAYIFKEIILLICTPLILN